MSNIAQQHQGEVDEGERFEFGKNWQRFLGSLNQERVNLAVNSLKELTSGDDLKGKTFLDIGNNTEQSGVYSVWKPTISTGLCKANSVLCG